MVFPCGHNVCLSCYNHEAFRRKAECPFCRKGISKAYRLWEEAGPDDAGDQQGGSE